MDVFLSINNREEVIRLPVVPSSFEVNNPQKNEEYETINQGDIKLIGLEGLKSISIFSFFPNQDYYFLRDRKHKGFEYVRIIEGWKERRLPIRLIITNTPINMAVTIDDFTYGRNDGTGDVNFTLELSEFKFVKLGRRREGS